MKINRVWASPLAFLLTLGCGTSREAPHLRRDSAQSSTPATTDSVIAPSDGMGAQQADSVSPSTQPPSAAAKGGAGTPTLAREVRSTRADSARGTVRLTGSCNGGFTLLSLGNDKAVMLEGSRALFEQVRGIEIVVFGRRRAGPFPWPVQNVDSFFVRRLDSSAALDGTLRREGGRDVLEVRGGRRVAIARLPDRLAKADGMRVWIAGPPEAPIAGGIIDPSTKLKCDE